MIMSRRASQDSRRGCDWLTSVKPDRNQWIENGPAGLRRPVAFFEVRIYLAGALETALKNQNRPFDFSQTTNKSGAQGRTRRMATTATPLAGGLNAVQRGAFLGALIGWIFVYYEVFLMTMLAVPVAVEFELTTAQVGMIFSTIRCRPDVGDRDD
jgi:hypothetical protein